MLKMSWPAQPKQYQDVKAGLWWYTVFILLFIGLSFYLLILPDKHSKIVDTLLGKIDSSKIVGSAVTIILFEFVGFVLIFLLEIHDKFYDRYITKWRYNYDVDFIIPMLVRPFIAKLDNRFFEFVRDNRYESMKVFYYFVADYEHDHKIIENLIVRFYEAIMKFWITQINEIILFIILLIEFVYYLVYSRLGLPLNTIVNANFIIALLFLVNRWAVQSTRKSVRRATTDEIENIHERFLCELEQKLRELHEKFDLRYDQN